MAFHLLNPLAQLALRLEMTQVDGPHVIHVLRHWKLANNGVTRMHFGDRVDLPGSIAAWGHWLVSKHVAITFPPLIQD